MAFQGEDKSLCNPRRETFSTSFTHFLRVNDIIQQKTCVCVSKLLSSLFGLFSTVHAKKICIIYSENVRQIVVSCMLDDFEE